MAFNPSTAWCMMSTIFEGCVMKLIIELGMLMQTSHSLLMLFASYFLVLVGKRENGWCDEEHPSIDGDKL